MISKPSKRFLAFLLDEILIAIISMFSMIIITGSSYLISDTFNVKITGVAEVIIMAAITIIMFSASIIQLLLWSRSTSIGKAVLGMEVVNKNSEQQVGFIKMLLRELIIKQVSGICFGVGYIWILIDKNRQSWHDKILNTLVVDKVDSCS